MAKAGFEASKIIMMLDVGEDSSLIVHLIANSFGASDCLTEDLGFGNRTPHHLSLLCIPLSLIFFLFWVSNWH
jgi:hypothetical protein